MIQVPSKSWGSAVLEASRIEEFCGRPDAARRLLQEVCGALSATSDVISRGTSGVSSGTSSGSDLGDGEQDAGKGVGDSVAEWKTWLEAVLVEQRAGDIDAAVNNL